MTGSDGPATAAPATVPPKKIRCGARPIRARFAQQIAWGVIAGNLGVLFVVALYYLFVQAKWPGVAYGGRAHTMLYLKPGWDGLFGWKSWPADRHDIRNIYEGAFAVLFGGSILAGWRGRRGVRKAAPPWYVLAAPALVLLAAAVPVVGGVFLLNHAGPELWHQQFGARRVGNPVRFPHALSWLATYLSGFPWQPFVIGFITGRVVRKVWAPAGNAIQLHFVARAVDAARDAAAAGDEHPERHLPRWPLPPVVRERAWWLWQSGQPVPDRHGSIAWSMALVALLFAAVDGFGGYVKYVIARGH